MKKLLLLAAVVVAVTGCRKNPDFGELSSDFVVVTDYNPSTDFSTFTTFYVADTIYVPTGNFNDPVEVWDNPNAQQIINVYVNTLTQRGFVRSGDRAQATLGLQLAYIQSAVYYAVDPYWWWDPFWWGGWSGWYYPYPIMFGYSTGSLMAQMVDLTAPTTSGLPVVWDASMEGVLSGDMPTDLTRALTAAAQSMAQSPYITK